MPLSRREFTTAGLGAGALMALGANSADNRKPSPTPSNPTQTAL